MDRPADWVVPGTAAPGGGGDGGGGDGGEGGEGGDGDGGECVRLSVMRSRAIMLG